MVLIDKQHGLSEKKFTVQFIPRIALDQLMNARHLHDCAARTLRWSDRIKSGTVRASPRRSAIWQIVWLSKC